MISSAALFEHLTPIFPYVFHKDLVESFEKYWWEILLLVVNYAENPETVRS
jgi:hypothetical protein